MPPRRLDAGERTLTLLHGLTVQAERSDADQFTLAVVIASDSQTFRNVFLSITFPSRIR
jgi:hypothetical protein